MARFLGDLDHEATGVLQHVAGPGGAALGVEVLLHGEEVALHHEAHGLRRDLAKDGCSSSFVRVGWLFCLFLCRIAFFNGRQKRNRPFRRSDSFETQGAPVYQGQRIAPGEGSKPEKCAVGLL